jgi:hypothetical protein
LGPSRPTGAAHTLYEIEAISRLLLNLFVPTLQHPRALVGYGLIQMGLPLASTARWRYQPGSRSPFMTSLTRRASRSCT